MRTRTVTLLGVVGLLGLSTPATAQTGGYIGQPGAVYGPAGYGGPVPQGYGMPGQSNTLSPYLNMLGGTRSPAINYYNFTRPALAAGGYYGPAATTGANPFARPPFFPPGNLQDFNEENPPTPEELEALKNRFPATGHPAGFNNSMGYFGGGVPGGASFGATGQPRTTGMGAGSFGTPGRTRR